MTAVVGMPKAKPAYFLLLVGTPMFSQEAQMNISTPSAPPIIDMVRLRFEVEADPREGEADEPWFVILFPARVRPSIGRLLLFPYPDCRWPNRPPQRREAGTISPRVVSGEFRRHRDVVQRAC